MYILSEQRDKDPLAFFEPYSGYLNDNKNRFPKSAFSLATSDWYFNPRVSGCPHDAWLESITVSEPSTGQRHEIRTVEIRIELLGPYHDGKILMRYPVVYRYEFEGAVLTDGHSDWRFDEFRVNEEGHLVHEIEWWGLEPRGRWIIEASDVEYVWLPFVEGTEPTNSCGDDLDPEKFLTYLFQSSN